MEAASSTGNFVSEHAFNNFSNNNIRHSSVYITPSENTASNASDSRSDSRSDSSSNSNIKNSSVYAPPTGNTIANAASSSSSSSSNIKNSSVYSPQTGNSSVYAPPTGNTISNAANSSFSSSSNIKNSSVYTSATGNSSVYTPQTGNTSVYTPPTGNSSVYIPPGGNTTAKAAIATNQVNQAITSNMANQANTANANTDIHSQLTKLASTELKPQIITASANYKLSLFIIPEIPSNINIYDMRYVFAPKGWEESFHNPINEKDWIKINNKIEEDERLGYKILPKRELVFNAFRRPPHEIKVVIIGQDPYPDPLKAMGMSFSAPRGTPIPESLKKIYREIKDNAAKYPDLVSFIDLKQEHIHPDLTYWADQGVLLLNTALTVREKERDSHKGIWLGIVNRILITLLSANSNCIYVLWGGHAKSMSSCVSRSKYVLEASHPSPVNTRGGFLGCEHFSMINTILTKTLKQAPIDWNIYPPWELAKLGYVNLLK